MAAADPSPVARALCACPGCGMPAISEHAGKGPPDHEAKHGVLPHCQHHETWIGTYDANVVAVQRRI